MASVCSGGGVGAPDVVLPPVVLMATRGDSLSGHHSQSLQKRANSVIHGPFTVTLVMQSLEAKTDALIVPVNILVPVWWRTCD
jgi:hypothetical protein